MRVPPDAPKPPATKRPNLALAGAAFVIAVAVASIAFVTIK